MQFSQGSPAGTGNITFHQKATFAFAFGNIQIKMYPQFIPYLVIHVFFILAPHDVLYSQLFEELFQHLQKLYKPHSLISININLKSN